MYNLELHTLSSTSFCILKQQNRAVTGLITLCMQITP